MSGVKNHPIQLKNIIVKELSFKMINPVQGDIQTDLLIQSAMGAFDEASSVVSVGVLAKVNTEKTKDVDMRVEIIGLFSVSPEFPVEHLPEWSQKNAPYLLYPFLREQVYGLTLRAGIAPILLPLVEVPRRKKEKEEAE